MIVCRTIGTGGGSKIWIDITIGSGRAFIDVVYTVIFSLEMGATGGMSFSMSSTQVLPDKMAIATWEVTSIYLLR